MKFFTYFRYTLPLYQQVRYQQCCLCPKPRHLICFKDWTAGMVMEVINSAMNLKCRLQDTHQKKLTVLPKCKIMILQEVNEPILNMAVSKAATLLGANDVNIVDKLVWDHDYYGRVFSCMADAIFVATTTHWCVQRFADQSSVPVLCMRSRTHASIQALATVMSIIEEYGTMKCVNVSYLGSPHPILNSYLLLCPMLGANIKFKCCCEKCPVSPLLSKASEDMTSESQTQSKACQSREEVFEGTNVVIAGPTHSTKHEEFKFTTCDIENSTCCNWIFYHTCPKGPEVDDDLFFHCRSCTFSAFNNMQYIAAALMAIAVKGYHFKGSF